MKISIHQPWALNEVGQRDNNEDSIFPAKGVATTNDRLFVVCDGVGGVDKGEEASALVCQSMSDFFADGMPASADEKIFFEAFEHAQQTIDQHIAENPTAASMATTLTLLSLTDTGATIMWCGDSRVYQFRGGKMVYRTEDHSFVGELVRNGLITREEAATHPKKNVITRAMQGSNTKEVKPEIYLQPDVQPGDVFFLCTDGVLESVSDEDLEYLFAPDMTIENAIQRIHELCLNNSRDNFSCYAVQVANIDGSSVPVEDFQKEEITVQAHVIHDATAQRKVSKQPKQPREIGTGLKILFVVVLLGLVFAIYFFGIRKPASNDVVTTNDSTKTTVVQEPSFDSEFAAVNGVISYTEQQLNNDSLSFARDWMAADKITKAKQEVKDSFDVLQNKINDLDSLCQWLAQAQNLHADVSKKPNAAKKKSLNELIDRIVEFDNTFELDLENFKVEANKLKPKK